MNWRSRGRIYLAIGAAALLGGGLRAVFTALADGDPAWPWPTFAANVTGCLLIGLYWGVTESSANRPASPVRRAAWMTGLFGGLTTFSGLSLETALMMGESALAASGFLLGGVCASLLAVLAGLRLSRLGPARVTSGP